MKQCCVNTRCAQPQLPQAHSLMSPHTPRLDSTQKKITKFFQPDSNTNDIIMEDVEKKYLKEEKE